MILKNKKLWIVVMGLVIVAAAIDAYFVRKYQEVPPPVLAGGLVMEKKPVVPRFATTSPSVHLDELALAQMKVTDELRARFEALVPPLDTATAWSPEYMKWENDKGYTLMISAEESVAFAEQAPLYDGDIVNTFFSAEMQIAKEVFTRRGFVLNHLNSSTSTRDAFAYDYVQSYEKGDEYCSVVVNLDNTSYSRGSTKMGYILTVVCGGSITSAEKEQIPLLDALKYRNTGMKVGYIRREGDFVVAGASGDRGGMNVFFKKEGSGYRVLTQTQEGLYCDVMDAEKIPIIVVKNIADGKCIEKSGYYRRF